MDGTIVLPDSYELVTLNALSELDPPLIDRLTRSYTDLLRVVHPRIMPVTYATLIDRVVNERAEMVFVHRGERYATLPDAFVVACGQVSRVPADPPWAVIDNIIVREGFRRQGLARNVLEYLETYAKENWAPIDRVMLMNGPECANVDLYKEMGYKKRHTAVWQK